MNTLSLAYDAPSILFGAAPSAEPLPAPDLDEVVMRVGAWTLLDLRDWQNVLMWNQHWYDELLFSREQLIPGVYCMRLPIPASNNKNFAEQKKLLLPGEEVAPAALVAVALLCHLKQSGNSPLNNDRIRCAEVPCRGPRVELRVKHERVRVYGYDWDGDDFRSSRVSLAGFRKY